MRFSVSRFIIYILAVLLVLSGPVSAGSIVDITGSDGTPGIDGANGDPGESGTAGDTAADVTAVVNNDTDPQNWIENGSSASVIAGAGGAGGAGGSGDVPDADGGDGGDGGSGGNAMATANSPTTGGAEAVAYGGDGADGGAGGAASGIGTTGATGRGGDGGNAFASASGAPFDDLYFDGGASGFAGNGGDGSVGGNGGNGEGYYETTIATTSQFAFTHGAGWGGNGGNGSAGDGGDGGYGISDITAVDTKAYSSAVGGNGGSSTGGNGGRGGDATTRSLVAGIDPDYWGQAGGQTATGGNGGDSNGGVGGDGGNAIANGAGSEALGGNGGSSSTGLGGLGGTASADATPEPGKNNATANADAAGGDGGSSTGSAGRAGGGATAVAAGADDIWAEATGGRGGNGADSGDGGAGGNSSATARGIGTSTADASVFAIAGYDEDSAPFFPYGPQTVGNSGRGGDVLNGAGNTAGMGGSATAVASNDVAVKTSVLVKTTAVAFGGDGGNIISGTGNGGAGGDANSVAELVNIPTVRTDTAYITGAKAVGGQGGDGRGFGFAGGNGGSAIATTDDAIAMFVTETVAGGSGGTGYETANGGAGGDTINSDTVTGSVDTLNIRITQRANAGRGGDSYGGTAGAAGNAASDLTYNVTDTDSLTVFSAVTGGEGGAGFDGSNGSQGAAGTGLVNATNDGLVVGTLQLNSGNGGDATGGGQAGDGADIVYTNQVIVNSISTGDGNVYATLFGNSSVETRTQRDAAGGDGYAGSDGGNGGSVSLTNAVDAATGNGAVSLTQQAFGGQGGNASESSLGAGDAGVAGRGGNAYSELNRSVSQNAGYSIKTVATSGSGGDLQNLFGTGGTAGDATAISVLYNETGSATVEAVGSLGRRSVLAGSAGGASSGGGGRIDAQATAATNGDNNEARAMSSASGEFAPDVYGASVSTLGGSGSAAYAAATASSRGNSAAYATSQSEGGDGGVIQSGSTLATHGAGGLALATSNASNDGSGYVESFASAIAGASGAGRSDSIVRPTLAPGNATATAIGTGNAETQVTSEAAIKPSMVASGLAIARSTATGNSGQAESRAYTELNPYHEAVDSGYGVQTVSAIARSPVSGTVDTVATVGMNRGVTDQTLDASLQAQAYVIGLPDASDIAAQISGYPTVSGVLDSALNSDGDLLAYGYLGATYSDFGIGLETYETVFGLGLDRKQMLNQEDLVLAFIDAEYFGDGFESLSVSIEGFFSNGSVDGFESIAQFDFIDLDVALLFFTDNVINLGAIAALPSTNYSWSDQVDFVQLTFTMALTTANAGDGFGFDMLMANTTIPLPAGVWLFGSALGALAWLRRCRRNASA